MRPEYVWNPELEICQESRSLMSLSRASLGLSFQPLSEGPHRCPRLLLHVLAPL